MRLDVWLSPVGIPADALRGRPAVMIDVLRASTSMAVAMSNGARHIMPVVSVEEARAAAAGMDQENTLLAGERQMRPPTGFHVGNSPLEFRGERVRGKCIVWTTSNGTRAIDAARCATSITIAAYVNFSTVLAHLLVAVRDGHDVAIVCAGKDGAFSLEDAACAGRFAHFLAEDSAMIELNDAALSCLLLHREYGDDVPRLFRESSHGRDLEGAGFHADLEVCSRLDSHPVLPVFSDRFITVHSTQRE